MKAPRVTVVIVNWNGREFLAGCLGAVAAAAAEVPLETIVIDNGSSDGSQEFVQREFPAVQFVQHERNDYTAANNLGVAEANGEYALLLNTDATLRPGCLRALTAALDADAKAAAAAPRIVFPDGRICTTGIEQRDDLYWVDRDAGDVDPGPGGAPQQVLGVSGCCALFRIAAWREVGGQDEDFHMYYEDVDLALRLRAAGWRSLHVPGAVCEHVGHGSIKKAKTWKDELGERNRLLVLARHFRGRFPAELVRSPWFQSAAPEQLRELLPKLAVRFGTTAEDMQLELMLALRDAVRAQAGELDAKWGQHRNLPKILGEREEWIATLLEEVARLRLWRLPGKRLKPAERAFLDRVRGRRSP
ncbi:MAG TPA: glycosyltransferase family 2 protein [Planctomycetota bacterium]|nr:glycosyltransferase family 2 protein [Planctomycetota bacterium]